MPSFRAFHWSFAIVLPVVFGGCIFRSGDDHDHRYFCEGPGCYDDGDGVGATGAGAQGAGGQASGGGGGQGQGGEGGAPPSCDPNEVICSCVDAACPGDLTCVGGQCLATCGFDYDCGPGLVCGNGQCVPGCDDETPCGAGYACVGGGCLIDPQSPQCIDSSGCDGLECIGGFCTTACATHADCGPGQLCDGATLGCVADLAPVPLCDDTTPCPGAGQACLSGTCHYECVDVLDCKLIDARFDACDEGFCKTDLEASPECTAASPCAGGEACVSNLCVPAG